MEPLSDIESHKTPTTQDRPARLTSGRSLPLRALLPDLIPQKDKELVRLLRAAGHAQRYPATDTKRGRPSKWKRKDLLRVVARLEDILHRETSSQISFASFVDHYLRLSDFPSDVIEALENGDINLFEAEQLARVNSKRLEGTLGKQSAHAPTFSHLTYRLEPLVAASGSGLMNCSALLSLKWEKA